MNISIHAIKGLDLFEAVVARISPKEIKCSVAINEGNFLLITIISEKTISDKVEKLVVNHILNLRLTRITRLDGRQGVAIMNADLKPPKKILGDITLSYEIMRYNYVSPKVGV